MNATDPAPRAVPPVLTSEAGYLIGLAARAPSVHNTQPWRFRVDPESPGLGVVHRWGAGSEPDKVAGLAGQDGRNGARSRVGRVHTVWLRAEYRHVPGTKGPSGRDLGPLRPWRHPATMKTAIMR